MRTSSGIRGSTRAGYFWIDAICINQADNKEKSFQVASMGDIFKESAQTLACVGRHENDSKFLFQELFKGRLWLRPLREQPKYRQLSASLEYIRDFRERFCRKFGHISTRIRGYRALRVFLDRPYFRRVWIYQELFFGSKIQICCGDDSVDLSKLWTLYSLIRERCFAPRPSRFQSYIIEEEACKDEVAKTFLDAGMKTGRRPTLLTTIHHFGALQSEDPRDRLYGILALIKWDDEEPILPDYDKDRFDLASEVLRKFSSYDFVYPALSKATAILKLLDLPSQPSSRLLDEVQRRRSKCLWEPPMGSTSEGQDLGLIRVKCWGGRIHFHNGCWRFQSNLAKDPADRLDCRALGREQHLPSDEDSLTMQKWSEEYLWDLHNTDILLSQEVEQHDWLLFQFRTEPAHGDHLAWVARDICDGQIQLVGKALISLQLRFSRLAWKENPRFEVHLDYDDAIILSHSYYAEWTQRATWLPRNTENEAYMYRVNSFFETGLCGDRSRSHVISQGR